MNDQPKSATDKNENEFRGGEGAQWKLASQETSDKLVAANDEIRDLKVEQRKLLDFLYEFTDAMVSDGCGHEIVMRAVVFLKDRDRDMGVTGET